MKSTSPASSSTSSSVAIVEDFSVVFQCDRIEKIHKRASMVSSLIQSYDLKSKMTVLEARKASREELTSFHSHDYIEYLEKLDRGKGEDLEEIKQEEFGLGYDCPILSNLMDFVEWIAGSSIVAAESLTSGNHKIAINWNGGWHHAQRDSASGFCYVNDIVLAIHQLRKKFDKVLYVDLDVHHGDGVENAFAFSPKVFTFSIHKFESGYFPGTGRLEDNGFGKGINFSANCPLKNGIDDDQYEYVFTNIFDEICYAFRPDAIVVQCGGDVLAGDPLGGFNLTLNGLSRCVKRILAYAKPSLFLGGGGYNLPNTAMYWAYLTSILTGTVISTDIPESDEFFSRYGPSFELCISPGLRPNENTSQEVEDILEQLFDVLENVSA